MERYRTTLILAAVLLVLVGAIFFMSGRNPGASGTPTTTPTQYVWEETNPAVGLTVVSDTGRIVLEKDTTLGSWRIVEPVQEPADFFAVSGIADSMQKLTAMYTLSETTEVEQFGLNEPMTVTLEFSGTTVTERTLLIGDPVTDLSGYYVKTPDSNQIYVIGNTLVEPMRGWLTTPPVMQPTATLAPPLTVVPPATPTTPGSPETSGSPAATPDSGITPTVVITATTEITTTSPGAANPTTPGAATPTP
ncbi:MAG TPA: DUF4340 domain-containing protein [Chloroflexia bacterium]|nr:DUF4340 domain-containing protein [Chloroflexia bacterium]